MSVIVTVRSHNQKIEAEFGENLLYLLRKARIAPEAPCGGHGTCGKCRVLVNGKEALACSVKVEEDLEVWIPKEKETKILERGMTGTLTVDSNKEGYFAAFDIGTTTVVCYLLDGVYGSEFASASMINPQTAFGADVVSRIEASLKGALELECSAIREGMKTLILEVCQKAKIMPEQIKVVAVVANPCMQQLFMGMSLENLAVVPFQAVLKKAEIRPAAKYLPECGDAELLVLPNLSGYIGSDTIGCVISTNMDRATDCCLMVDIGTNGEMLLCKQGKMVACSTAAGPALEGAKIRFGMRAAQGAIDHVWLTDGRIDYHVIGEGQAEGICGSGLIDAVAVMLELGVINQRGRIQTAKQVPAYAKQLCELDGMRVFYLTEQIYLTQQDIREVQLAKGAIAAGIAVLAEHLEMQISEIDRVMLAGAFGSFMNPTSACRIGLLPKEVERKIESVGNAAGMGAKMIACDKKQLKRAQEIAEQVEVIELASLPSFQSNFGRNINF